MPTTRDLSVILRGITLFSRTKSSGKIEIAVGRALSCSAVASLTPICAPSASFNSLIVIKPILTSTEPKGIPKTFASASAIVSCLSLIRPSSIKISPIFFVEGASTEFISPLAPDSFFCLSTVSFSCASWECSPLSLASSVSA